MSILFCDRCLLEMTCWLANVLKTQCDVNKGDTVIIYMPTSPMAVAAMLACARIGAVHWHVRKKMCMPCICNLTNKCVCQHLDHLSSSCSVLYSVLGAKDLEIRIKAGA